MATGPPEQQHSPHQEMQEPFQDRTESSPVASQRPEAPHAHHTTESADPNFMDVNIHIDPHAPRRAQVKTPEPTTSNGRTNGHNDQAGRSPGTPGHLAPFDWEDFESRYERALLEADDNEKELLEEFDRLIQYFNVWASAASAHDTERGIKRLQTRERYVKIAEQSLAQKKKHFTEVVRAFQSALALLSQS